MLKINKCLYPDFPKPHEGIRAVLITGLVYEENRIYEVKRIHNNEEYTGDKWEIYVKVSNTWLRKGIFDTWYKVVRFLDVLGLYEIEYLAY